MEQTVVFELTPKVPVDDFLPELMFEFPDVPHDAMVSYVLRSIDRLCEKANVLRRTAIVRTQRCVKNYLIEPPDCMDVIAIMAVDEGKRSTHPFVKLRRMFKAPNTYLVDAVTVERNELIFTRPLDNAEYIVTLSVKPRFDACEVDAVLKERFYDVVQAGVKSALCAMAGKNWSNNSHAEYWEKRFLTGAASAAVDTLSNHQRGVINAARPRIL